MAPMAMALACSAGPIDWREGYEESAAAADRPMLVRERSAGARLFGSKLQPPAFPNQCTASVRVWWNDATHAYAAWWSLRSDSSADIVASSSVDGRTWAKPVRVDTADIATVGCKRQPPAIAGDGDNVHVVYAMRAKEGPGYFLSHSMDGGRAFHSPVAVVYGVKLGLAAVAAGGNFVIVAYEDPNTTPTRISIAVSTTMAHLFEYREVMSSEDQAATAPSVFVDGTLIVLNWRRANDTTRMITRRGQMR